MSGERLPQAVQDLLRRATTLARQRGHRLVESVHLLAVLDPDGRPKEIEAALAALPRGTTRPALAADVVAALSAARRAAEAEGEPLAPRHLLGALPPLLSFPEGDGMGRRAAAESGNLPETSARYLAAVAAVPASTGGAASPRGAAVDAVLRGLLRSRRHSVVLLGPRDLGAADVVAELAGRLAAGAVPPPLRDARLLALDTAALVADAPGPGQLPGRLRRVLADVGATFPGTLLYVDDLPVLCADPVLRAVLTGTLRDGAVRLVGAAASWPGTGDALDDFVWPLPLAETTPAETAILLDRDVWRFEAHHGIRVEADAVSAAVEYAGRYLPDRRHPGRAIDLLDEAAAGVVLRGDTAVTADDVAAVVSEWARIPLPRLLDVHGAHLLQLEARLHERVVGQDEAVAAVAAAIRRARAGVADRDRPLGSFLFLGPTGVGKTELARTLAQTVFPDEAALIVLDMSEYAEPQAVARLVGAPPGYVGFSEGGRLSERLRARPSSVVLLDEIEKAHPDVYNVLLQVLDEGRLTDGRGATVDARDAVFVLTSNTGGELITTSDLPHDELRDRVLGEVRRTFRPEFLNRLDEVLIFRRLDHADLSQIVDLQIAPLARRLDERGVTLVITPAARRWLVEAGYDPAFGARPLRRVIRRRVADPIATAVLDGTATPGTRITVDVGDEPAEGLVVRPSRDAPDED